ncbi:MAG TPA: glycosyltransferase family 2 protein [Gemmataceae bacterium]|jgi:glycosyltransferase involved in cell wall biosynthesis|nr:glycosyltransferase family 2 protein [Gemmataceae bacterium]
MMNDLAQLQTVAGERLTTILELREELQAARAQIHALEQKMKSAQVYRHWRWRQLLKRLCGVRLGITPHYSPRPISFPARYGNPSSTIDWPTISVVTPSFRQGPFLERTMRSVLDQHYPKLEYIVKDGGSSDETVDILKRYEPSLTYWESSRDGSQARALNWGFRRITGEIMAYLNSDDLLIPGALHHVAEYFHRHPEVDVVYGHRIMIDENDLEVGRWVLPPHDNDVLSWADYVPQETLFWRRRIWDKIGGAFDESFDFALDWDLLIRFRDVGARLVRLPRFLGCFRLHPGQKTSSQLAHLGLHEMNRLRERCNGRPVSYTEISRHIAGYLFRHVIYHRLYLLGILRY